MGLFTKKSADEKAREFAAKRGVDVSGAVAVGRAFEDGVERLLVVHPGRVEWHHLGAALTGGGAGVTSIPGGRIGSVSTRREGIWGVVSVQGSGVDVEFRTDLVEMDRLAGAIRSVTLA